MNDGGLSWLRKSYQRMKEQAERENCSIDDLVVARYGVRINATLQRLHVPGSFKHMRVTKLRILTDIDFMHASFNTL